MKYLIAILLLRQAYVNKKRRRIYLFLTVLLFSLPLISTIFYQTFLSPIPNRRHQHRHRRHIQYILRQ